ncbi:MAG: CPBP family intramembrane metalloprotease [Clostridiales bacterium]|nr:CPBP family intramembrane metalloprotease [Clostridiales bacterium]MCC8107405.1 CPBP family intramembrane metalloprotease [Clostridiales bacterium]
MSWVFYVLSPVMISLVISEMTAILAGNVLDSAARTALSAVFALPFGVWMYRQDTKRNAFEQHRHMDRSRMCCLGAAALCLFGGGLLNVFWSWILKLLQVTSVFSNETQEALFSSGIIMQLLGPGLLVPLTEELIFRGLLYGRMRTRLQMKQAVLLSALLFAFYHGNPVQILYAFPMALLLAILYERGESLIYPILFHMGANLTAIFLQ